jgi:hypothetical protein
MFFSPNCTRNETIIYYTTNFIQTILVHRIQNILNLPKDYRLRIRIILVLIEKNLLGHRSDTWLRMSPRVYL